MLSGYRITSPYGNRISPIGGNPEFHTGIDLVKGHQQPIQAFVAGEVIHAKEGAAGSGFGGYGIVVAIVDNRTGHLHCYAHLDSALVRLGQTVEKGQIIGRQGSTGKSTGSHLHYEIRKTYAPKYGWVANKADNCFEPVAYLNNYYSSKVFTDVPNDHWCRDDLELLKSAGILDGYEDGSFRGDSKVSRYELASAIAAIYRKGLSK